MNDRLHLHQLSIAVAIAMVVTAFTYRSETQSNSALDTQFKVEEQSNKQLEQAGQPKFVEPSTQRLRLQNRVERLQSRL